jgi:hypothetical protein
VRREEAVVAVAVDPRGRDQAGEPAEELARGEHELGAAMCVAFRKAVEQARVLGGEGGRLAQRVQAFERERGARAVAHQPLDTGTVVALDPYGGVHAEAAGTLPGQHVAGVGVAQKPPPPKYPQHTALHNACDLARVLG